MMPESIVLEYLRHASCHPSERFLIDDRVMPLSRWREWRRGKEPEGRDGQAHGLGGIVLIWRLDSKDWLGSVTSEVASTRICIGGLPDLDFSGDVPLTGHLLLDSVDDHVS